MILTRAMNFDSASAAALFVTGAKGQGLAGWIRDNDVTLPSLEQRYLKR